MAGTRYPDPWHPQLAWKKLPYLRQKVLYQMPGTSERLDYLNENNKNTYFFEFSVTRL